MEASTAAPAGASPKRLHTVIEPTKGWSPLHVSLIHLRELWQYREVGIFLAVRDVKIRYRQTAFGVLWIVAQPLLMMVVISVFFGLVVKIPSDGVPYPILVLSALVPWTMFAQSLTGAANSMLNNEPLISKVYFPRLLLPLSAVCSFLLDFCVSMVLLIIAMFLYGATPTLGVVLIPALILLSMATAISLGTILAALNVRYRDVAAGLPLALQIWLFASPVVYPLSLIPEKFQTLYGLNPMATVVSGFRWALLGTPPPPLAMAAVSVLAVIGLGFAALVYFRRTERTFADII
jgi:lipopolysaccharide transport system permease protein